MRGATILLGRLEKRYPWLGLQLFFFVLSILSIYIFSHRGILYDADDLKFHVDRINGLYQAIMNNNSILMMPSFKDFKNVGDMVQSFYPMVTLLPFVFFRFIFFNPVFALYAGLVFFTYIGFLTAYLAMFKFSKNILQSASFALIYNLSIYHLTDLFIRFDLGEWLALIFYPIAIYGFFNIFFEDGKNYNWAVVGLSLVAYSHILATFFLVAVAIVMLIIAIARKNFLLETSFNIAKGIGLFSLQILFTIYPLVLLTLRNHIHFPTRYNLMVSPGGELASLGTFISESANNQLNRSLGVILIIIVIGGFLKLRKMPIVYKYSFLFMCITALLTTSLFPWYLLQKTPIAIIQFPWRLLGVSGFFMAVVGSWLVDEIAKEVLQKKIKNRYIYGILIMLSLPSLSAEFYTFYQKSQSDQLITNSYQQENSKNYSITSAAFSKYFGKFRNSSDNTDYYTKSAFAHKVSIQRRVIYFEDQTQNKLTNTKFENNKLTFYLNSEKKQTVDIPIIYYRGINYQLSVNNKKEVINTSRRGTMKFVVSKGTNKVVLKIKENFIENSFIVISLFMWFGYIVKSLFNLLKKKRKSKDEKK